MSSQDGKDLVDLMDPMVEDKFKEFIIMVLRVYQNNPTKQKMRALMLNLPLGLFLKQSDIDKLINLSPPKYQELLEIIKNKEPIIKLLQGE